MADSCLESQVIAPGNAACSRAYIRHALIILLLVICCDSAALASDDITLATKSGPKAVAVASSKDPAMQLTAQWCIDYLRKRGLSVADSISASSVGGGGPLWVLETRDLCPVAKSLGVDCSSLAEATTDAYVLTVEEHGRRCIASIVGANVTGVRSGLARLICLLKNDGDKLTAPITREADTPFFGRRELVVANRCMVFKGTPWEYTHWRTWSDDRIRTYAEQIWLLGFNSMQTHEGRYYRAATADKNRLAETIHKTRVLMQAARDNGLQVSQLIWGQSPYNKRLCWNTPADRTIMEQEFRFMAQTYGSYVDRVVINFRDPGGCPQDCQKCDDYRTPQEIASFLRSEYRKINPNVAVTLSTWQNPKFWDGAARAGFLDETYMPRDVAIALHKTYNAAQAKRVHDAGRAVDIWSWYVTDHETTTDLSLCMTRVDSLYNAFPDSASKDVRLISNELCFHGWPNILSAYVTGQKMWNPHRDLHEIEREFCSGMFGERNADAMVALYQACELVVNPPRGNSCLPALNQVFGNPDYNKRFRTALDAAKTVKLDPNFVPTITTATEPQSIIDYLTRNLSLITVLSEAQEKVNAAKKAHASQNDLNKIVADAEIAAQPYKIDLDYPGLMKRLKDSIGPAAGSR